MWFRCGQISVSVDDGDSSSVCHLPNLCNWHHFAAKLVTLRSRLDGPGRYLEVSKKKKNRGTPSHHPFGIPQKSSSYGGASMTMEIPTLMVNCYGNSLVPGSWDPDGAVL